MFSKKTIVIVGVLFLIVLNMIVFSLHLILKTSLGNTATRITFYFISPVQGIIHSSLNFVDELWENYFYLVSVSRENNELRKKIAILTLQNNSCKEIESLNQRLRELVDLESQTPLKLIAAEVIAKDPSSWYQTVIINKGKSKGVVENCPVIISEGIVGYVVVSSSEYAKVLLATDQNSSIDAIIQRTRERGIVEGAAVNQCKLNYVARQVDVEVGDTIVTSGFDGIYPKGIPIGRISNIVLKDSGLFKEIEVTPFVDFTKLEEVMVILEPINQEFSFGSCGS